jgi:hypothetical protein
MSKRKYPQEVSRMVYGYEDYNKTLSRQSDTVKGGAGDVPVHIVRRKFLLRLLKSWEGTPDHWDYMHKGGK